MGRLRTITDEQIIEAAREVFLAEGFGASTVDIARRAGISEGSIFKRFATKENLFFTAMGGSEIPAWVKNLDTLSGNGNLKENLVDLALQMIDFLRIMIPRVMMLRAKGHLPPPMDQFEPPIYRDLRALSGFFEAEIQCGRIRCCDPAVAAHTFLGVVSHHVITEQMSAQTHAQQPSDEDTRQFALGLVEFLWHGLAPTPSHAADTARPQQPSPSRD